MAAGKFALLSTRKQRDDVQWRRIYAVTAAFVVVMVIVNVVQLWKLKIASLTGGYLGLVAGVLPMSHARAPESAFRPKLFTELPSLTSLRASAKVIDNDLFKGMPDAFDPAFKAPCFNDSAGQTHCLPYFLVLSGFQSGIQDLQAKMLKHPDIVASGNPQPHHWAEKRPNERFMKTMDVAVPRIKQAPRTRVVGDFSTSTFATYWAMSPRVHQAFYRIKGSCWSRCKNQRDTEEQRAERIRCVTLECYAPSHAEDRREAAKAGLTYEQMQTPLLVRALYGKAKPKFIVMLRNPVARLHSAYWFYGHYWARYGGKSPQGFYNYISEQIQGYRNCTDVEKHDVFHCSLYLESLSQYLEDIYFHCDQLMRGMYSIWLHIWFTFFPQDSFLVLQSEEYFRNPRTVLTSIFKHLSLRTPTAAEWDVILAQSHVNAAAAGHDMLPQARQLATDFYKPFNRDLVKLLGDKKWAWDEL